MLSEVSNVPPANACKTSSDLVISSQNLLTKPDSLVQSRRGNAVVDSRKTKGKAMADFRVESTGRSEAVLASAETSKASNNVGGQSATLTATCSSDHHLDAEHSKYDTGDKITRQTRLSKSRKLEITNSVALPYEDKMYNAGFNVKGDLARHKKTHDTEHSLECNICKHTFTKKQKLIEHVRGHTGERPFQCSICGHRFIRQYTLKEHIKTHTDEHLFRCDACHCAYRTKVSLIRHRARVHTDKNPLQCQICRYTFVNNSKLKEHMRTHTSKRSFKCTTCNKSFTRRSNLMDHMSTHSNTPGFKCNQCGARFYQNSVLRNHIRTHSKDRPFKCDKCDKTFKTSSNLWTHGICHTNERPFTCDICNAGFKKNYTLKKHKRIHTEKHPHKANKKSSKTSIKKFTNNRNPGQPEPDHNNEKSFESSHCDASFTSTTNQHIKPKTHTTHSETELTIPDDVSTISQLPSVSNQPSTSDIYVNKLQNPEEYGEYSEYGEHEETVVSLDEFINTYPATPELESCGHCDDLCFDQEIPEETFPDKQNADAGYLITQLHPVAGCPLTSGIHVNKSQHQEKYEEIAEVLDYNHLQTIPPPKPSWNSGYPLGDCDDDDFSLSMTCEH